MIKKVISFTLIFLILFLGYQLLINFLKTSHSVTYSIKDFKISEDYSSENGDYYLLYVEAGDKSFVFETENTYNKQQEIVKDVKVYDKDDTYCMSLIYKNKNEASIPLCYMNNVLYSYNEAKEKVDLTEFTKDLKFKNTDLYKDESEKRRENDVIIYNDYLQDNEVVIVYDYKKINYFDKKFARYSLFSNIDNYKNIFGTIVSHYYVIPRLITAQTFNSFVRFEINEGVTKDFKIPYNISKQQSYLNGVYDNKIYIFDKSNLKQYAIDPIAETAIITGDEQNPCFAYINGETTTRSVYEMSESEIKFSEKTDDLDDVESDFIVSNKKLIIYTKDGSFYKAYKKYPNTRILLFTDKEAKEIKVKEDNIYYLKNGIIYRYNSHGNVPLLERSELIFNYENSFDIYLK